MHLALATPNLRKQAGPRLVFAWMKPILGISLTFLGLCDSPTNSPAKVPAEKAEPGLEAATLKRDAVAVANDLATQFPSDPLVYALLGSAHFNIGQADEALRHLRRCIELNPDQADVYEIQGRIAYDKGQIDESVHLFQEALKRGSPNADLLNRLGRAQLDLGKTDDAQATLQQAVQLPDAPGECRFLLGQSYLQAGAFSKARDSFQAVIQQIPDHTQAFFGLFTACTRLGLSEDADRYRKEFVRLEGSDRKSLTDNSLQPDSLSGVGFVRETVARTFAGAGQLYRAHNQLEQATEQFRRAAMLDGSTPSYRAALESLFLQRKLPMEGIRLFEELTTANPTNYLNHLFLGRLQSKSGMFEPAEKSLLTVQKMVPGLPEGHRALGDLYLRANRKLPEALAELRISVDLDPSPPHFYLLSIACAKNKDPQGALNAIQQAIKLRPNEGSYLKLREQLLQARQK
jgi:tetratricopeptide (TPR) repeat protein